MARLRNIALVSRSALANQLRQTFGVAYGDGVRGFVQSVRGRSSAGDAAIVLAGQDDGVGNQVPMAEKGWAFSQCGPPGTTPRT